MSEIVISVRGLRNQFGSQIIHEGLDLDVRRGEVLGVVGGSGTGKSVLLRSIVGLNRPAAGTIDVGGIDLGTATLRERRQLQQRWGVLFQDGALFSGLTVAQNIQVPMREHLRLPRPVMNDLAAMKIGLVGLPQEAGPKFPSELSGGMRKRAGLARALALDPEIIFLDEPTAGLDPIGAAAFDTLIGQLRDTLNVTVFMVTHDLDSLSAVCDRVAVLAEKRVLTVDTLPALRNHPNPWIQSYFHGPRGRAAEQSAERQPRTPNNLELDAI
jgi:phospholipid/cholesterol/gamma-HCH transport system ATP-binding protein